MQRCADCGCIGLRTQIRSNSWICGLTANGFFFIQRSRCCDHNEYSVKILHAVRSAITAIAELLVLFTGHQTLVIYSVHLCYKYDIDVALCSSGIIFAAICSDFGHNVFSQQ